MDRYWQTLTLETFRAWLASQGLECGSTGYLNQLAIWAKDPGAPATPAVQRWHEELVSTRQSAAPDAQFLTDSFRNLFGSVSRNGLAPDSPIDVVCDAEKLAFIHGHHRLACAVHLGLRDLPLCFIAQDRRVVRLASELSAIYPGQPITTYQPIPLRFFDFWRVIRPETETRAAMLEQRIPAGLRGVDMGAITGAYARMLARKTGAAVAVECSAPLASCGRLLCSILGAPVQYRTAWLEDWTQSEEAQSGDWCPVAMNLLHHWETPDEIAALDATLVRWMRARAPVAYMMMGGPYWTSAEHAAAWWRERGYAPELIETLDGKRWTFELRRL